MEVARTLRDDGDMNDLQSKSPELHTLCASARELQRAAGQVLTHAAEADEADVLAVSLAHIEEALDRLAVGMLQMANTVAVKHGDPGASADATTLPPTAQALYFHLRLVADKLQAPQLACQASRRWTRRLLASESTPAQPAEVSPASEPRRPAMRSIAGSR